MAKVNFKYRLLLDYKPLTMLFRHHYVTQPLCQTLIFLITTSLFSRTLQSMRFYTTSLTSLEQSQRDHVGVDHGQVEWGQKEVRVGEGDKHGAVSGWVPSIDDGIGLICEARVGASGGDGSVSQVQLGNPSGKLRSTSRGGSDVAVVGPDRRAGVLPLHVDLLSREGKRLGVVVANGRTAAVASDIDVLAAFIRRNSR